jgi:pyruvate dehydrogenase E1 component alpha subunit
LAHAARYKGEDTVALVLMGDGATSEGDTHEALNFAAVWKCPVVFLVQNNGYAISVPLSKQTAAPSLAAKGIGYGIPSVLIDGNDAAAVFSAVRAAVTSARAGGGPTLIEAITYRMDSHTNADDATRYRSAEEVQRWSTRDPIERLERYLINRSLLDPAALTAVKDAAETFATSFRERLRTGPGTEPTDLFRFVYHEPTAALRAQQMLLTEELSGAGHD